MNAYDYWSRRPFTEGWFDKERGYRQDIADRVMDEDQRDPGVVAPERVIEYGCGVGTNLAILADRGVDYLMGVDINLAMLDAGRERWPNIEYRDAIPLMRGRYFHVALTVSALDHLEDPREAVGKLDDIASTLIFVEPWSGAEEQIAEYTWSHDYAAILRALGRRVVIRRSPLGESGSGPLYRRYTAR